MPLTEWDSMRHFLAPFFASALATNAAPASLLVVGEPGVGKSALIGTFHAWPATFSVSNITVSGLHDVLTDRERVRVLIMDEWQKVFARPGTTSKNLASELLGLMSGSATQVLTGPKRGGTRADLTGRRLAVVSACPDDVLTAWWEEMQLTGLHHRFFYVKMAPSPAEWRRVEDAIFDDDRADLVDYPIPPGALREPLEVKRSAKARELFKTWARGTFPGLPPRGLRLLVALTQGVAILNGRDEVTPADVRELATFEDHLRSVNFEFGQYQGKPVPPLKRPPSWAGGEAKPRARRVRA